MADGDLTSGEFDLAFIHSRSETGSYRDAAGVLQVAAADVARFDHDVTGAPLGLFIAGGVDLGGGDQLAIDPLILPAAIVDALLPTAGDVTVLHHYDPGSGAERRAWYSRDVVAALNALCSQGGHHLSLGVVPGFRPNEGGFVRYRGYEWQLPPLIAIDDAVFAVVTDRPIITGGTGLGA